MSAKIDLAVHEAGHAVIALDEGIGIGDFIRSSLNDGYAHFAPDIRDRAQANPAFWAPKISKALLAGQLSQERHVVMEGFSILDGEREAWAEDDRKCYEIAAGGLSLEGPAAEEEMTRLRTAVTERIGQPKTWSAIQRIAKSLNRCGRLSGNEVETIFRGIMGNTPS